MTDSATRSILAEALRMRAGGDLRGALEHVRPVAKRAVRTAPVAGLLGTLYFEAEQWKDAARWFALATELKPEVEHASLGLFHSLWELDKREEALREMARFRAAHHSGEYDRLHREMTGEFLNYMACMNGVSGRRAGASGRWRATKVGRAGASAAR